MQLKPVYRNAAYRTLYTLSGTLVLGYYTRLTFDKKAFALHHENGIYRPEYEWHFSKQRHQEAHAGIAILSF